MRVIFENDSLISELTRYVQDNLKIKDIKLYNKAMGAVLQILRVIITTEQCKEQVEKATLEMGLKILDLENKLALKDQQIQDLVANDSIKDQQIQDLVNKFEELSSIVNKKTK
ncbi:hypothetical protein Zmor_008652 [Zophobas morio]|uniref:Uncharacterized protein n=1 Tax=Zophobas morio TaxID=2755281 RepID=A0AA38HK54_9CUCU|nr:hypothetical protein Zmor_008652 [Zophobas morio]